MRKGPYPMDLVRQVKVRIDEDTFNNLTNISEETQKTKSRILRDFITRVIAQTVSIET